MQCTAIEVHDLYKACDEQPVLLGVSFAVGGNGIFGIGGRDSAGWATTVPILQGLRSRDGGHGTATRGPRSAGWLTSE